MAHDAAEQPLATSGAALGTADPAIDASTPVVVDRFGLSPLQQGMLFHHVEDPHSGVDIEQLVVHLSETVDPDALSRAWTVVVQRHAMLRARFTWEDGQQPRHEILANIALPFLVEDHRDDAVDAQGRRLAAFLNEDRVRGFDLREAPLLRITLFRWAERSWSMVWTFHHVLLDGRTFPILLGELFDTYEALRDGNPLPASRGTSTPFRRHVEWLERQSTAAGETFFKTLLTGFRAPTSIAIDRLSVAASADTLHGEAWAFAGEDTTRRLRQLAQSHGLTMNTIVMGAWAVLLQRYSGDTDVVFGATRACRRSSVEGADSAIGLFINTVPVRVAIRDEDALLDTMRAIRRQWLAMRPFEHTPLARIKAHSEVPAAGRLFDTLVVFEGYSLDSAMSARGGDWATRRIDLHELTSFPLTLAAYDGESLGLKLEYNRRTIDAAAANRLLHHLVSLLGGMAARPEARIRELTLLTAGERDALIGPCDQPSGPTSVPADGAATLQELFERQAARHPDAVAVCCDGSALTYSQLNAQANRLARELVRQGVGTDVLVGLYVERSNTLLVAVLAILKAGGAYLPIDRAYPADRIAFMLHDSDARLIVTESALASNLPATAARLLCLDHFLAGTASRDEEQNLLTPTGPDHLAYVIYTSGTTGRPKGSLITHRNVVRLLASTERWFAFNEHDVWTLFHSCAFDFSVWEIWGALAYGGRLVVVPFIVSRSPEAFYDQLARERVTVLNQTPSAFRQLIQAEEATGQQALALRFVIFGGEALDMRTLGPWFARHGDQQPQLVNMYGITETTVHVTCRPLSRADLAGGSVIGVPIPDLQLYVLDPRGEPAPIGIAGELYVGGAGLARGYLRRPELTSERFVTDHLTGRPGRRLYRTGDVARRLPDGDIEYLGRLDNQVKIRGFRIELGEIESVLTEHPAIREAVVVTRDDPAGGKRLVAYFTGRPAPSVSVVREHLGHRLPSYMVPAALVALEAMPLTDHGKIDRRALPEPESERPELATSYVAPATPAEETLAAIWTQVLGVERIGVHDNFFALGGDSILSIRVLSLARRAGLRLTPGQFFTSQTIARQAAAAQLSEAPRAADEAAAGDVPLTPIQAWFFEQELAGIDHFNQAFLFETIERLERAPLERALAALREHHDAFRLRYCRANGVWHQRYAAADAGSTSPLPLTWASLTGKGESARRAEIAEITAAAHRSLNIEHGPLWRVVYIDGGTGHPSRLLIVVHHLAIDGVSWRPLLEDLETAYCQIRDGKPLALPPRSASFKAWAVSASAFAASAALRAELPFWQAMVGVLPQSGLLGGPDSEPGPDRTHVVSLTADETRALLQDVPSAYHTQINDVLLTALARAWERSTGSGELAIDLEGHGRETLEEDLDLSRTVGWFTSMFPVGLRLPSGSADEWHPGEALKAVKEQLRLVPRKGVGYGLLRYMAGDPALRAAAAPALLFNYLGQFDQVIAGSTLFRFASESSGSWRSPRQRRHHQVEVNGLVIGGAFQASWTCGTDDATCRAVQELAAEFLKALREVIAHCRSSRGWGRTPSDFPLARLDQPALDGLLATRQDVEDVLPLSPMQTLFITAQRDARQAAFDQWHCTLRGPLDSDAFQRAWCLTLQRHSVLRSSVHTGKLPHPVTLVHASVEPRWTHDDWRSFAPGDMSARWAAFLADDRRIPLSLCDAPAMRFALIRTADDAWKFVWSVPSLLLDGWSWPVVFHDVSRIYEALVRRQPVQLEPARPYRDYLSWLATSDRASGTDFWRKALAGFHTPTPLASEPPDPADGGERYARIAVPLSPRSAASLQTVARQLHVTIGTLVQAVWALLLGRQAGASDVVFGVAFSGRPADLPGVDSIVGPFVNNLPVRVRIDGRTPMPVFISGLHARLLELSRFQFTPIVDIQRVSEVAWRQRLFESLVVVQNYQIDDDARRVGPDVAMSEFVGPVHTNFAVLLLAEPENSGQSTDGFALRLTLIYDCHRLSAAAVSRWSTDLAQLIEQVSRSTDRPVGNLQALLSAPTQSISRTPARAPAPAAPSSSPLTDIERTIAAAWQRLLEIEYVGLDDNFFDAGGTSLLIVQLHHRLRETLRRDLPLVELFEHPTVRSLARRLEGAGTTAPDTADTWRRRAHLQKQVLARTRRGHQ
ncbi:MAG TPA: amino acid adenylation domain-containing protein [Vicinamibacterales bacterium]|nr:amino acid adenylation domain-containing protein [Vicinamibacterales bacterium]